MMITRSPNSKDYGSPKLSAHNCRLLDAAGAYAEIINDYGSTSPRNKGVGMEGVSMWVGIDTYMPAMPECRHDLSTLVESYLDYVQATGKVFWQPVQKEILDNGATQYTIISDKHVKVTDDISFIYHTEECGITIETAYSEFEHEVSQYNTWLAGRAMVVKTNLGHASASVVIGDKSINQAFNEAFADMLEKSNNIIEKNKDAITMTVVFDEQPFDDVNDIVYKDNIASVRQLQRNVKGLKNKAENLFMIYGHYDYNPEQLSLTFDALPMLVTINNEVITTDIDGFIANTKQLAKDNNLELDMSDSCIIEKATETDYAKISSQAIKLSAMYTLLNNMNGAKVVSIKPTNK